jgi:DNA primase
MSGSYGIADEIRSRVNIVDLVSEHVALRKAGRNWKGLCPFHGEKTPSFTVNEEKQIFHCFGCGEGGDVFSFVMKRENVEFKEALSLLARRAGVELKDSGRGGVPSGERDALRAMLVEARAFYIAQLDTAAHCREYLAKRAIAEETAREFGLGFAPDSWQALTGRLKAKGFADRLVLISGLAAEGKRGPYDMFRDRLMFPIEDAQGELTAFGGRILGEGEPKYLNSPDTPLFSKRRTLYALGRAREAIRAEGAAMVVEGYMDVIGCHQGGFRNVVAPLGTALTEEHVKILKRYANRIVLVFDGDRAGVQAARRSLGIALAASAEPSVLLLPEGEDPDSLIRTQGAGRLRALMGEARSPMSFFVETSGTGKTETVREALGLVAGVPDPLTRDSLLAELADRTGVREMTLREELGRMARGRGGPQGASAPRRAARGPLDAETLLLSIALASEALRRNILGRLDREVIENPLVRGLLDRLAGGEGPLSPASLARTPEETTLLSRLAVEPGFDPGDTDVMAQGVEDCFGKLERRSMGERLSRIDHDIAAAERARDQERLRSLLAQRQALTARS